MYAVHILASSPHTQIAIESEDVEEVEWRMTLRFLVEIYSKQQGQLLTWRMQRERDYRKKLMSLHCGVLGCYIHPEVNVYQTGGHMVSCMGNHVCLHISINAVFSWR